MVGELKVVANHAVPGLAAQNGAAAVFHWSPFYTLLGFLPWALILALLLGVRRNRQRSAWGIWLGLVAAIWLAKLVVQGFGVLSSDAPEAMYPLLRGIALGGGAILLSPALGSGKSRWLQFLGVFLVVAACIGGSIFVADQVPSGQAPLYLLLVAAIPAVVTALTLSLAWRCCRRQARLGRFLLWLALWTLVLWLSAPLGLALLSGEPGDQWRVTALIGLGLGTIVFLMLALEFGLAFAQPFYRERLAGLVGRPVPPPADGAVAPQATASAPG